MFLFADEDKASIVVANVSNNNIEEFNIVLKLESIERIAKPPLSKGGGIAAKSPFLAPFKDPSIIFFNPSGIVFAKLLDNFCSDSSSVSIF